MSQKKLFCFVEIITKNHMEIGFTVLAYTLTLDNTTDHE